MTNHCQLEESDSQYLLEGVKNKGFVYFRYECSKDECKEAKTYTHNKKDNSSEVNS